MNDKPRVAFHRRSTLFAWNLPRHLSPSAKLTAMALFNYADDENFVTYDGTEMLLKYTGLDIEPHALAMSELVTAGYIEPRGRTDRPDPTQPQFWMNLGLMGKVRKSEDVWTRPK